MTPLVPPPLWIPALALACCGVLLLWRVDHWARHRRWWPIWLLQLLELAAAAAWVWRAASDLAVPPQQQWIGAGAGALVGFALCLPKQRLRVLQGAVFIAASATLLALLGS